jgi:hypothetical protein
MPRIPTTQIQNREVAMKTTGITARQNGLIGASNVADKFAGLTREVSDMIEGERKKADFTIVDNEFQNQLKQEFTRVTINKDTGFNAKRGKEAASSQKDYTESYSSFGNDLIGKMGTTRQKERAKKLLGQYEQKLNTNYTGHVANENERYLDGEAKASINLASSFAGDHHLNPKEIGAQVAHQKNTIDIYSKRKGLSPDETQAMKLKATTDLHMNVLDRKLAEGSDLMAKSYLEGLMDTGDIDSNAMDLAVKRVRAASVIGESDRQSSTIIEEGLGLEASKKKARESIEDPDVRAATVTKIDRRMKEERAETKFQDRKHYEGLGDVLWNDPKNFKIPTESLDRLTLAEQRSLMSMQHKLLMEKKGAGGNKKSTDWAEYERLAGLSNEDLQQEDIIKLQDRLTPGMMKQLIDAKADTSKHDDMRKTSQAFTGLVKASSFSDDPEKINDFNTRVSNELNRLPKDQRYKADTLKKVGQDALLLMETDSFFGGEKQYFQARKDGDKIIAPVTRPKNLPASASFVDKIVKGKRILGYEHEDPSTGQSTYYSAEGKPMFRTKGRK